MPTTIRLISLGISSNRSQGVVCQRYMHTNISSCQVWGCGIPGGDPCSGVSVLKSWKTRQAPAGRMDLEEVRQFGIFLPWLEMSLG